MTEDRPCCGRACGVSASQHAQRLSSRPDIDMALPGCACARGDSSDRGAHSSWSTCHRCTDGQQHLARSWWPAGVPVAAAQTEHRRWWSCLRWRRSRFQSAHASAKVRRCSHRHRRRRRRAREPPSPWPRITATATATTTAAPGQMIAHGTLPSQYCAESPGHHLNSSQNVGKRACWCFWRVASGGNLTTCACRCSCALVEPRARAYSLLKGSRSGSAKGPRQHRPTRNEQSWHVTSIVASAVSLATTGHLSGHFTFPFWAQNRQPYCVLSSTRSRGRHSQALQTIPRWDATSSC